MKPFGLKKRLIILLLCFFGALSAGPVLSGSAFEYGDVNKSGKVNVADAAAILRHSAGLLALDAEGGSAADVNGDNSVDIADAVLVLKKIVGLINSFPAAGDEGNGSTLCWPVEPPYAITSGFGVRCDPFTGSESWHGAIDIGTYGQPNYILAAESGKVILASWNGGYGNCIIIDHGGGTATLYGHLNLYLVSSGQTVSRGERIARAGATGNSTGVHLHFEVREYNKPPYRYYPGGAPDYRHNPMDYFELDG